MKILHISAHLGGGVGTVIRGWIDNDKNNEHAVLCMESANQKTKEWSAVNDIALGWDLQDNPSELRGMMAFADVVVVHYWQHPTIFELLKLDLPLCRMVFWCHRNDETIKEHVNYPDMFIVTSPVIGNGRYDVIWSTGGIEKFLKIEPVVHEGFNVGYVGTIHPKKIHPMIFDACRQIKEKIPAKFIFCGDVYEKYGLHKFDFNLAGQVDNVLPYFAEMDVFGYPLRPDHYGTSEQVLGEAMAAGVVPVCMDNPTERLIIKEGVTGFLCKNEQEYIDNIVYLYHKPELRKWMSNNCRDSAVKLYSIDTMIKKWNNVFEYLMAKPKREHKL